MEKFVKGDIVVIPFPFSDLSGIKKRPALVIADLSGSDIILCQITSRQKQDQYAIPINDQDFRQTTLTVSSNIRPNRIFTAYKSMILRKVATLNEAACNVVLQKLIEILS